MGEIGIVLKSTCSGESLNFCLKITFSLLILTNNDREFSSVAQMTTFKVIGCSLSKTVQNFKITFLVEINQN